jgi:archaemetzincin
MRRARNARSRAFALIVLGSNVVAIALFAFFVSRRPVLVAPARGEPAAPVAPCASAPPAKAAALAVSVLSDPGLFARKRPPEPGDWLERFHETGQSFESYRAAPYVTPTAQRHTIALQPLGSFSQQDWKVLASLAELSTAYFATRTTVAALRPLPANGRRWRDDDGRHFAQYLTSAINRSLAAHLPDDAVAYLGVTTADLYPEDSWNFVFGQASLRDRVGVYSLARFAPPFTGARRDEKLVLLRAFKVLAHEMGHVFSLPHCVEYECLMNGSNSLDETDRSPVHLCPPCLAKLALNLGFDVREREKKLLALYERGGLDEAAAWSRRFVQSTK